MILTSILFTILLTSNIVPGQAEPTASGISFQDFLNDRDRITGNFTAYDPGNIILVEDVIEEIYYWGDDRYETEIWLRSSGTTKNSESLSLVSDLTVNFKVGEKIRITLTIILNETGMGEDFGYGKNDIEHITFIKDETKEDQGIDLIGYDFSLPDTLDNNIGRFAIYLMIWLIIAVIVLIITDRIINRIVTKAKFDVSILNIIKKPIFVLILLYGLIISLSALKLPDEILYWLKQVYNIGLFIVIIWLIYKILNIVIIQIGHSLAKGEKNRVEKVLIPILQKFIGIFIFIFAIFTLLGFVGIDLTVLAVGGVLISMVIAFAAQDTLSNFFAGIFLAAEPDFKAGDIIMLDNIVYEIRHIGMRNSKLYDLKEHMLIIMPNNMLANNKIINLSEPDQKLKLFINIGVAYGTDPHKVKKILLAIAKNHPHILTEPKEFEPVVRFWEFAESSLSFILIVWLDDLGERFAVRNDINFEIDKRFKEGKVEIPFPQRVVHMRNK